jgi:hypothetical protein
MQDNRTFIAYRIQGFQQLGRIIIALSQRLDPALYPELLEASLKWIYFQRSDILDSYWIRVRRFFTHYTEKTIQFFQRIRQIGIAAELRRRQGKP